MEQPYFEQLVSDNPLSGLTVALIQDSTHQNYSWLQEEEPEHFQPLGFTWIWLQERSRFWNDLRAVDVVQEKQEFQLFRRKGLHSIFF